MGIENSVDKSLSFKINVMKLFERIRMYKVKTKSKSKKAATETKKKEKNFVIHTTHNSIKYLSIKVRFKIEMDPHFGILIYNGVCQFHGICFSCFVKFTQQYCVNQSQ